MNLPRRLLASFADDKEAYNDLPSSETESEHALLEEGHSPDDTPHLVAQKPSATRRMLTLTGRVLTLLLAAWGIISLYKHTSAYVVQARNPSEKFAAPIYPSCSCGGTTVAEAQRLGCIFTPLSISWLPPHCIDGELSDDFDRQGPGPAGEWDYWSDANKSRRLSREEVGLLADDGGMFYATQDWHVMHCVYTWMKHYRSRWTGVVVERRSNGLDHIGHCRDVLKIRSGLQEIRTVAGIALDADDPGKTELD